MVFGEKSLKSNQWYSISILQIFFAIIFIYVDQKKTGVGNLIIWLPNQ
jgi:hypothetical protein